MQNATLDKDEGYLQDNNNGEGPMKRANLVFLVALFTTQSFAQQIPDTPENIAPDEPGMAPAPMPLEVQHATMATMPYDRIMYVVDVSGSMSGRLAEAIQVTSAFGSDDLRVAVVTFNEDHARWEGVKTPCRHPEDEPHDRWCLEVGWAFMPTHNQELMAHLQSFSGSGLTNPTSALEYAFKNAPEGTLIVFISDGVFNRQDSGLIAGPLSIVRMAQAWRLNQELAPVQMLVWATSEADSQRESLVELAKLGGGGLWRADSTRSGPW